MLPAAPKVEDGERSALHQSLGVAHSRTCVFPQRQLNLRCCEHIRVEQTDELRAAFQARQQLVIVLGQEKLLDVGPGSVGRPLDYTWWPMDLTRLPRNEGLKSMVRWRGRMPRRTVALAQSISLQAPFTCDAVRHCRI